MRRPSPEARVRRGLAHVETFTVTLIVGLFAAMLLPEGTATFGDPQRAALADDLESLRTAIETYRYEHHGEWPAADNAIPDGFEAALLVPHDVDGRRCGPYVVDQLPTNPLNGLRTVRVVDGGGRPEPDDTTGWTYDARCGAITANTPGRDSDGRAYVDR